MCGLRRLLAGTLCNRAQGFLHSPFGAIALVTPNGEMESATGRGVSEHIISPNGRQRCGVEAYYFIEYYEWYLNGGMTNEHLCVNICSLVFSTALCACCSLVDSPSAADIRGAVFSGVPCRIASYHSVTLLFSSPIPVRTGPQLTESVAV